MIKKADNKDTNNTKSIAMRREFFTPFNQKWLADSEYEKITNIGALVGK